MLQVLNKRLDLRFVALFFFVLTAFLFFGSGKSSAVSGVGDVPNFYPNTSWGTPANSFSLVQVTGNNYPGANILMKARSTLASIYVPITMVNQTIVVTILDACNGGPRDVFPGVGSTTFWIYNDAATLAAYNTSNIPSPCVANHITASFVATAPIDTNTYSTDGYYIYRFRADGNMSEGGITSSSRYLNAFQMLTGAPGVQIGIADWSFPCDRVNYPVSCPSPHPASGISFVYSSFYGPAGVNPYGQYIKVNNKCAVSGNVSFYDFDADNSGLNQTNLKITLYRGGPPPPYGAGVALSITTYAGPLNALLYPGIVNWDNFPGVLNPHPGYGGNNDEYMDIPNGDPMFTSLGNFPPNVEHYLVIEGLNTNNAFQMRASITRCPNVPALDSTCYSVTVNGTPIVNGASVNVNLGDPLVVETAWQNSGTDTWTNLGGNVANAFDAGWDTGRPAPLDSFNQYEGTARSNLPAVSPGTSAATGAVARYRWQVANLNKTGTFQQKFRMLKENVAWFGADCRFTIRVSNGSTVQAALSCDLSGATAFAEVGDSFTPTYVVRYTPSLAPSLYPTVSISAPTITMTPGITPARAGTPATFTLAPAAAPGTNQTVTFAPVYTFASAGNYALAGSYNVVAPDGIGGNLSFTVTCGANKGVGNRPYMRAYGGEVIAGSSYSNPCVASADIVGDGKPVGGNWRGSGAQFGVKASRSIQNFATAAMFAPTAPSTLAFANTTANLGAIPAVIGGTFGAQICANQYWPTVLPTTTSNGALTSGTASNEYLLTGNTISLAAGQTIGNKITIYVNGDVFINSNLETSTGWATTDLIPAVYIIARGNIYIKPGVTRIDAVLVAEPTATVPTVTNGRIYTCFNNNVTDTADIANSGRWIATNCGNKLTINGALIAAKVNFLRTGGTVNSGSTSEGAGSANISEVIQFSPEFLLATPSMDATNTSDNLDSILSLPPSL